MHSGICDEFVQSNHSRSEKNVLRGLHFTKEKKQSQLVTVIRGSIYDVVVDIRRDSPTFLKWFGVVLGEDGPQQIYMTHGFAHGFCVLSNYADIHYHVSNYYDPNDDAGIRWDDPIIGIKWPISSPTISVRDSVHPYSDAYNFL